MSILPALDGVTFSVLLSGAYVDVRASYRRYKHVVPENKTKFPYVDKQGNIGDSYVRVRTDDGQEPPRKRIVFTGTITRDLVERTNRRRSEGILRLTKKGIVADAIRIIDGDEPRVRAITAAQLLALSTDEVTRTQRGDVRTRVAAVRNDDPRFSSYCKQTFGLYDCYVVGCTVLDALQVQLGLTYEQRALYVDSEHWLAKSEGGLDDAVGNGSRMCRPHQTYKHRIGPVQLDYERRRAALVARGVPMQKILEQEEICRRAHEEWKLANA